MKSNRYSIITGSGSYTPTRVIPNEYFLRSEFYNSEGKKIEKSNEEIIKKFEEITCIKERRYVEDHLNTSDIAYFAAQDALESSHIGGESLDYIIVAHNFGDVDSRGTLVDLVPSIASRVKHDLEIANPKTLAYDIITPYEDIPTLEKNLTHRSADRSLVVRVNNGGGHPHLPEVYRSARETLHSLECDKESLEQIIVFHENMTSIAVKVKEKLCIKKKIIAYDLPFGCPGWLQGVIQASYYLKSGDAKKVLVIGAETLSRISDPHDIDSMIYADGAGATIHEARESDEPMGMLSHAVRSDTIEHAYLLRMHSSYNPQYKGDGLFLKMDGHKLYEYALSTVPGVVKESIDKEESTLQDIKKILIHQANEKMDEAIVKRCFKLYKTNGSISEVMPMIISWLGNCSVATIPVLYDLLVKGKVNNHSIKTRDKLVFSSVGAGMNINSVVYKMP